MKELDDESYSDAPVGKFDYNLESIFQRAHMKIIGIHVFINSVFQV